MKLPFQSGYLIDIFRSIERQQIAQSGHFSKPIKRQLFGLAQAFAGDACQYYYPSRKLVF
jgi:hypothetical protein